MKIGQFSLDDVDPIPVEQGPHSFESGLAGDALRELETGARVTVTAWVAHDGPFKFCGHVLRADLDGDPIVAGRAYQITVTPDLVTIEKVA